MKKNRIRNRIISILLLIVVSVFGIYYYLGIQFGNATSKTLETVYKTKEEWDKKGVDPIDTIIQQVDKLIDIKKIDSTNSRSPKSKAK